MSAHLEAIRLELDYIRELLNDLQALNALVGATADELTSARRRAHMALLIGELGGDVDGELVAIAAAGAATMRGLQAIADRIGGTLELVGGRFERLHVEVGELTGEWPA